MVVPMGQDSPHDFAHLKTDPFGKTRSPYIGPAHPGTGPDGPPSSSLWAEVAPQSYLTNGHWFKGIPTISGD